MSVNLTSRGAVPDVVDAVKEATMSDTDIITSARYSSIVRADFTESVTL